MELPRWESWDGAMMDGSERGLRTVNACRNGWQWLRVDTCWFEGAFPTIPNHEPFPIITNQPLIVDGC